VIGLDIYARFIDAACRLQAGETVQYAIHGQTHAAVAPSGERFRNIIFKQVFSLFTVAQSHVCIEDNEVTAGAPVVKV